MSSAQIAIRSVRVGVMTLLLVVAAEASAQVYHPALLEYVEQAPPLVLGHSPTAMHALEHGSDSFDGFSKRRADGVVRVGQPQRWMMYGRFGLVKFRSDLDSQGSSGTQVTWRNTGPGLGGQRFFIGFQRRF
jgi:hypothetical protein